MLLALLFFLIAAHALMDYALQNDSMAACKCPKADHPIAKAVAWPYWLTAHALLHGAAVGIAFRCVAGFEWGVAAAFALAETVAHWCIDLGKCVKMYSIHVDQTLHMLCKLIWWGLVAAGVVGPTGF